MDASTKEFNAVKYVLESVKKHHQYRNTQTGVVLDHWASREDHFCEVMAPMFQSSDITLLRGNAFGIFSFSEMSQRANAEMNEGALSAEWKTIREYLTIMPDSQFKDGYFAEPSSMCAEEKYEFIHMSLLRDINRILAMPNWNIHEVVRKELQFFNDRHLHHINNYPYIVDRTYEQSISWNNSANMFIELILPILNDKDSRSLRGDVLGLFELDELIKRANIQNERDNLYWAPIKEFLTRLPSIQLSLNGIVEPAQETSKEHFGFLTMQFMIAINQALGKPIRKIRFDTKAAN